MFIPNFNFWWSIREVFIILEIINVLSLGSKVSQSLWNFWCRDRTVR